MQSYVKMFFFGLLTIGVPMMLLFGTSGLVIGITLSLLFTTRVELVRRTASRRWISPVGENASLTQSRILTINLPYEQALDYCESILQSISGFTVTLADHQIGKIQVLTHMTWKTFGDVVTVTVKAVDQAKARVEIESRPVIKSTLLDYGSNLRNVDVVSRKLGLSQTETLLRPSEEAPNLLRPAQSSMNVQTHHLPQAWIEEGAIRSTIDDE